MSEPTLLPPRRKDNTVTSRLSSALLESVTALAKDLGYNPYDLLNQGAEWVLQRYGRPVPPIGPNEVQEDTTA